MNKAAFNLNIRKFHRLRNKSRVTDVKSTLHLDLLNMKNAIKYGAVIGVLSGIWILILHLAGAYENAYPNSDGFSWLEYLSIIIPFVGLYFGIKSFRDNYNGGRMEFFEGIFEGFKIMVVGGIIAAFFATVYIQYVAQSLKMDVMGRIGGAGVVGVLFTLAISLLLMNKQRNL